MAKTKIITGLDVGTSSIKTIVAQQNLDQSSIEILGTAIVPSKGLRKGIVIDIDQTSKDIRESIQKVQDLSGENIDSVCVNLNGSHIFGVLGQGSVVTSRADQRISQEDINRVLQAAQTVSLSPNKEILHVFPKEFIIDQDKGIKNPLNLCGLKLEVETLIFGGFSPYIKNLTTAVLNAGLKINDLIISPLAIARAVLTNRQKELGVAIIDIGAETTNLAVFEEGNLIHVAVFPLGGSSFTSDIAICFRIDIDIAERIKLEYGISSPEFVDKKEKIEISEISIPLSFPRTELAEIIEARFLEIFDLINKELKKISKNIFLPAGIILTGGGAKIPNIVDLARKELKLPCQIGFSQEVSPEIEDISLFSALGLALWDKDLKKEKPPFGKEIISKFKKIFKVFIP